MRPELTMGRAAAEVVAFLMKPAKRPAPELAAQRIITEAAVDLLPGFARRKLSLFRPRGTV